MGGATFFLLAARSDPAAVGPSAQVGPEPSVAVAQSERAPARVDTQDSVREAGAPSRRAAPRDRMARDLERERIWSSLRRKHQLEPAAPGAAAPTSSAAAQLPVLDPQYIKTAIAEQLVPVAIECYQSALEDEPELAGKLITNFTIIGAEDIGGIVEDAAISEDSTLDSAFVRECMRESLMAVSFEPPPDGGRVEVTYPFEFEPE
ncbi:hypothetical protein DB30_01774 [Enhygromyxa salina]|uniref:Gram-negative bacterial tonB protein n=2 Tax=Enhygromyxa salina TaxID=215803 RepID=A0A0C1ZMK1_9BACT|nr:hypothetical protein DB30_01774 [Enhygromyxa salina]